MEDNKNSNLTKSFINRIVFVIAFFLIAMIITKYLIDKNVSNSQSEISISIQKEKTIDLNEYYTINQLKSNLITENYKGIEINYYQIDGLKNEQIQNSINYFLENDVKNFIDNAISENKINYDSCYVYANNASNFQNTISIYYNVYSYKSEEEDYEQLFDEYITENFDLTTGNRITLNDLFTKDTRAADIITDDLYKQMLANNAETEMDEEEWYLKIVDYKDIEDDMLEFAMNFNNKKDMKFMFDEKEINVFGIGSLYYEDFLDKVVIYDKYKTEDSIFTGQYNTHLTPLLVLEKRAFADYQVIEQGKNYYIDISLFDIYNEEERDERAFELAKDYIDKEVEYLKQKVDKNSDEFLIANYSCNLCLASQYDIYGYWYSVPGKFELDQTKAQYWTTRKEFNMKLKDKIIDAFRHTQRIGMGEEYLYDNMFVYYLSDDYDRVHSEYTVVDINENGVGEEYTRY